MNKHVESNEIKIGYVPLAHETYWKFFPSHEQLTIDVAATLRGYLSQFGTIVETGKLIDSFARATEARLLFQAEDVDVIVLGTVTYSTPDDIILDLKRFNRPVVVWNTQASAGIPADMDFNQWMLEHGVTGVPGITKLLEREGMPYFLISGHHSDPSVKGAFLTVVKALTASKRVWGSRLGMIGHLYPGMIDFGYDPTTMYTTFGAATVPILEPAILSAYEGVDERIRKGLVDLELSIGDYVLSGGELGAMVVIDAVSRLLPGVLGGEHSATEDSFEDGLLEYPHFTRPEVFKGKRVPSVLLSGDHEKIRVWRRTESLKRTLERRPDLLKKASLTKEDKVILARLKANKE